MTHDALIACPGCSARLRRPQSPEDEASFRCPRCEHVFVLAPVSWPSTAPTGVATAPLSIPLGGKATACEPDHVARLYRPTWVGLLEAGFTAAGSNWSKIGFLSSVYLVLMSLWIVPAIVLVRNYPDGFDLNLDVVFPEDDFIVHEAIRDLLLQPGLFWLMSVVWMGLLAVAIRQLRRQSWRFATFFLGLRYLLPLLILGAFHYLMVAIRLLPPHLPWLLSLIDGKVPEGWFAADSVICLLCF